LLFAAAVACGLVDDDSQQSVMATIASGLRTSVRSVASPHLFDGAA
jgi:hypothetical protein